MKQKTAKPAEVVSAFNQLGIPADLEVVDGSIRSIRLPGGLSIVLESYSLRVLIPATKEVTLHTSTVSHEQTGVVFSTQHENLNEVRAWEDRIRSGLVGGHDLEFVRGEQKVTKLDAAL